MRMTAIAALPEAVDSAYIVESASSIKSRHEVEEKLRRLRGIRCEVRAAMICVTGDRCRLSANLRDKGDSLLHGGRKGEAQRKTRGLFARIQIISTLKSSCWRPDAAQSVTAIRAMSHVIRAHLQADLAVDSTSLVSFAVIERAQVLF